MWYIGQKVVCVDAGPCQITRRDLGLVEDKIYVIERITPKTNDPTYFGFSLVGVPDHTGQPLIHWLTSERYTSTGLDPARFRPVVPDKAEGCDEAFKLLLKQGAERRLPVLVD